MGRLRLLPRRKEALSNPVPLIHEGGEGLESVAQGCLRQHLPENPIISAGGFKGRRGSHGLGERFPIPIALL